MISYTTEGSEHPAHDTICIFTDGAIYDGQSSGSAVIGILNDSQPEPYLENIEIYSKYHSTSTNNVAELTGILFGLEKAFSKYRNTDEHTYSFLVFSDSEYAIKSLTEWVFGWYKTYTYERKNGIVVPSMMTKGGTPVKNCELICAIVSLIANNRKNFIDLDFINVKGHTWQKTVDTGIIIQMEYYEKANQCNITKQEATFIAKYNHIVDRVASNVCSYVMDNGFDINFDDCGDPCMEFVIKGMTFRAYDSVNDGIKYSDYMVLTKGIMKAYRDILEHKPF